MRHTQERIFPEGAQVHVEFLGQEGKEVVLGFRGTAVFDAERNGVAMLTCDLELLSVWLAGVLLERRRELKP